MTIAPPRPAAGLHHHHLIVHLSLDDRAAAIDDLRRRMRVVLGAVAPGTDTPPFLVATPLGLMHRTALVDRLRFLEVEVTGREKLASWPVVSTALYLRGLDDDRVRVALTFEALWHRLFRDRAAERWWLRAPVDLGRLALALRAAVPPLEVRAVLRRHELVAELRSFHVPHPERIGADAALIESALVVRRDCAAATPPRRSILARLSARP